VAGQHALFRSEIVIFQRRTRPHEDDLTREAVAEALGVSLRRDEASSPESSSVRGPRLENVAQQCQAGGRTGEWIVLPNPNGGPDKVLSDKFDAVERTVSHTCPDLHSDWQHNRTLQYVRRLGIVGRHFPAAAAKRCSIPARTASSRRNETPNASATARA